MCNASVRCNYLSRCGKPYHASCLGWTVRWSFSLVRFNLWIWLPEPNHLTEWMSMKLGVFRVIESARRWPKPFQFAATCERREWICIGTGSADTRIAIAPQISTQQAITPLQFITSRCTPAYALVICICLPFTCSRFFSHQSDNLNAAQIEMKKKHTKCTRINAI